MVAQIVRLSARSLLARAQQPPGVSMRIAGLIDRATSSGNMPANPARSWIVLIGKDGEGILIRSFALLFHRRVLHELFELCADHGVEDARSLHQQRCWLCRGDDFIPALTAYTLHRFAFRAGRIPHDVAMRAGVPIRYLAGGGS